MFLFLYATERKNYKARPSWLPVSRNITLFVTKLQSDILESSESKFYVLIEFFPAFPPQPLYSIANPLFYKQMTWIENNWHGSQKQNFRNQRERQDTVGKKTNKLQTGPAVLDITCQKSQRRTSVVKEQDLIAPADYYRF